MISLFGPVETQGGYCGNSGWNCQRSIGVTLCTPSLVSANSRTESRSAEPATRSGCWCSTAEVSWSIRALRLAPGGIGAVRSGDWPECSSQSGPFACAAGDGHSGRTAGGSFSVAQSAA